MNAKEFRDKLEADGFMNFQEYAPQPKVNIRSLPQNIYKIVKKLESTGLYEFDGYFFIKKWTDNHLKQTETKTIIIPSQDHDDCHQQPNSVLQENNRILMQINGELELDIAALKKYKEDTKNIKSELDDALFWKADTEKKYQASLNIIQIQEERIKELEW